MSSLGAGYDLSATTYSPEGRLFQVEYALKAVDNSGTAVGIRCKDGVVLGVEKLVSSKMLVPGSNKRIHHGDTHVGVAITGLLADGRLLVSQVRSECRSYRSFYGHDIPARLLNERMSMFVQKNTLYGSARPYGVGLMLAVYDLDGPQLFAIEPSGVSFGYFGHAFGKGRQQAKSELEKLKLAELTCAEAVNHVARIIHFVHDEVKDKAFELELSWVCDASGRKHEFVPPDVRAAAIAAAKAAVKAERGGESDSEDD